MIKGLTGTIILTVVIISFYHVMWAPIMFRRYSLDFNFLLGFLVMFGTCGVKIFFVKLWILGCTFIGTAFFIDIV